MDDLFGLAVENSERLIYGGLGLGTGFVASYSKRYIDQRKGLDLDYSSADFNERMIEEDPITDLEDFEDNRFMELYYDNFDHVKKAAGDSKNSIIYTVAVDGMDRLLGENNMGFDEYPEAFAGAFIGLKIGRKTPTPVDVSNAYSEILEKIAD